MPRNMKFFCLLLLAASLAACAPAPGVSVGPSPFAIEHATAAAQMYIQGLPGWMPETPVTIRDFHWGISEPRPENVTERPAVSTDRREFQEVHFLKDFDTLTPRLMEAAAAGRMLDSVRFVFSRASAADAPFAECLLENVQVAGVRTPADAARGLQDEVFLGFQRLTWKSQPAGSPEVRLGWDLVNKRAIEN